jgi:NADPH-dependent 2,4-dienoyl-CoA reductase/sulfur reductase-like enzyme/Pyruvate/2-oxoacid:ferredoxin oxidoreductase delta subunit
MRRISEHPVLETSAPRRELRFRFDGADMAGLEGETISAALFANGVTRFSEHRRDGAPQGIFCANGQCAQCTVLAGGRPVKACVTALEAGMEIGTLKGVPVLPAAEGSIAWPPRRSLSTDVLVVGGGPAGLGAASELASLGLSVVLADDKESLGGKLVLQTHKFFGSEKDCYAGRRGFEIARELESKLRSMPKVAILSSSPVVGVFKDGVAGVYENSASYLLVRFRALLVAAGARERSLVFPGNQLPGVYGAGAFQTLVNRDRVKAASRVLVVGSGNVGLIAAYHALQAGIEVAGIVEIADRISGYRVHADKIRRLGVPVHTSTTIVSVEGEGRVERATVARVGADWKPLLETARTYEVDTVLVAAGLSPCDELYRQALSFGLPAAKAGDADEIAEASSALFGGRIAARELARRMGLSAELESGWLAKRDLLKSKPGDLLPRGGTVPEASWRPVFFCDEEIPCDPCTTVCPSRSIALSGRRGNLLDLPDYKGSGCSGCAVCVAACPGLAISLVRKLDADCCEVVIPYELPTGMEPGEKREILDREGRVLESAELLGKTYNRKYRTSLLRFKVSAANATKAIGLRAQAPEAAAPLPEPRFSFAPDEATVCRCERVSFGEIVRYIRENEVRDVNQLKALRAGMGACGSKTCAPLYAAAFRAAGIDPGEVAPARLRPLEMELPLGALAERDARPRDGGEARERSPAAVGAEGEPGSAARDGGAW